MDGVKRQDIGSVGQNEICPSEYIKESVIKMTRFAVMD